MGRKPLTRAAIRNSALITAAACAVTVAVAGGAGADPPDTQVPLTSCPALFALGIQGTGESSPDAAVTTDTGMLSTVFRPMMNEAGDPGLVDRAYVPYEASFGGATEIDKTPYAQSITQGLVRLRSMAKQVTDRCPQTRLAIAGYSQGAHVASLFAQEEGAGQGAVPPDRIAAVALFGDPTRMAGASVFPGASGKTTPDPAPDTPGTAVAALPPAPAQPVTGSGIGLQPGATTDFGQLVGRVASFCTDGDLACDAPNSAPLVRTVANIASQVELSGGDPIASLKSIADALAYTSIKTVTTVVNNDVQGTSLTDADYEPQESISQRIADAADPNSQVDMPGAFQALLKIGTLAINSVVAVVKNILTPTNIAEIATAGLANPLAGLAVFGTKLVGAVADLVPPTTISRLVTEAFSALTQNVTDNKDMLDISNWVKYWNTAQKHDYTKAQGAEFGNSPTQYAGSWFAALAHDLSGTGTPGGVPKGGSDKPPVGMDFAPPSSTVPTTGPSNGQFPLGADPSGTVPATTVPPLFGAAPTAAPTVTSAPPVAALPLDSPGPSTTGAPLVPTIDPEASR